MFSKNFILFVFLSLVTLRASAQQQKLFGLLSRYHHTSTQILAKPDTAGVNLLNAIANEYAFVLSDSVIWYSDKVQQLASKINYPEGEAMAYANKGKLYYNRGDYEHALPAILKALNISDQKNYELGQANANNLLGLIYLAQNIIRPALLEFKKAVVLNKSANNQHLLATNYFNIAVTYFQDNKLDSSAYYLNLTKTVSLHINDQQMLTMANNKLGEYQFKIGNASQAIALYNSVINNKSYQNDWENSFAYTGLAECYYQQHNYQAGITNGQKGFLLAKKLKARWDAERALKILQNCYYALGEYKQAYHYSLMDKTYQDSVLNEAKDKELNTLYLKQKQAENQVLVKQNQIARQENRLNKFAIVISGVMAVFLGVLAALMYQNAAKRKRLNKFIEQQNAELLLLNNTKDQLFSIIGHDLRSPFAAIIGTLGLLKAGELDENEKELVFNQFFEQVTVSATMLENLLLWANSQQKGLTAMPVNVPVNSIMTQVLDVYEMIAAEKEIKILNEEDQSVMILADADQVRIMFQNLIANAIKFTPPGGLISVNYQITEERAKVIIKDTGVGIPPAKLTRLFRESGKDFSTYGTRNEKGVGLGLILVQAFAQQNQATIQVTSEENTGTTVVIDFIKAVDLFNNAF